MFPPLKGGTGSGGTALGFDWARARELCSHTGHVLCECPTCGFRQFCAYRPKSQAWPACFICRLHDRPVVRMVPVDEYERDGKGQLVILCKNPGQPRTDRQLKAEGFVKKRSARPDSKRAPKVVADPRPE